MTMHSSITTEVQDTAFGILIDRAIRRAPVRYGEFVKELNAELQTEEFGLYGVKGSRLYALLRHLCKEQHACGLGMISALVVSSKTGMPGNGFFSLAAEIGIHGDDREIIWKWQIARVYSDYRDLPSAPPLPTPVEECLN